jgi:multicomponent K+:H+ antiporter subunit E
MKHSVKRRILPYPLLSLAVFALWLLLIQSASFGNMLLAAVLGIVVPLITSSLRPAPVRIRRPLVAAKLLWRVAGDAVISNVVTARALLTKRSADIPSDFVHIPLDLRDPNALAVMAMIVCWTPGTAWAEISLDRSVLLLHVFELRDRDALVQHIKQRYERPLMEIFE